jgi:hypothetical protein
MAEHLAAGGERRQPPLPAARTSGSPPKRVPPTCVARGTKLNARLAQPGDLRGKKTKFRLGKKWLDIGSVLEHDFTRD